MQFGAIFSAVGACKKAVDFVKDVQKVPEDAIFLWKLVDSLEAPVMLAVQLMGREATLPFVSSVLDLTHDVLFACEVLLVRADPEGRPYEPDSWQAWWSQVPSRTKDDLSRMKLLPRVTSRLSDTAAALQAALLTTQMRVLSMGPQALVGSHPLRAEDALSSYEGARRVLHLFEMGRLPESSATYQLWVGRVSEKGRVLSFNAVVLLRRNSSGGYELVVVEGADVDSVRESHPASALSGRLEVEYTTNITPPKKKSKTPNVQPIAVVPSAHLASSRVSIMPNAINITVSASKAELATEDADDGDLRRLVKGGCA